MVSGPSPWDSVQQWLASYEAAGHSSAEELRALRQELERLDERQLRRFLDWLGERGAGPGQAASAADAGATRPSRIAGFGLPRLYGGSPWSLRPRRKRRQRPGLSA